jgi:hypothetical protein
VDFFYLCCGACSCGLRYLEHYDFHLVRDALRASPTSLRTSTRSSAQGSAGQLEQQTDLLVGEWPADILEGNRVLDDVI